MGRDPPALLDHLVDTLRDGAATHGGAATAVGAHAELHLIGVAVNDIDVVDADAELVGHDLGERGDVTLAVGRRPGVDRDCRRRVDPHDGALPQSSLGAERPGHGRRRQTAGLDEGREADTEGVLTRFTPTCLLFAKIVVARHLEGSVESRLVISTVVLQRHLGRVRELVGLYEVLAPDLGGIDTGLVGREIHQSLHYERRLRATGSPIGIDWSRIREDPDDVTVDRRDVVLARHQGRVEKGRDSRGESAQVGPHRSVRVDLEADDLVILVEGDGRLRHVIATVRVGHIRFAARGRPLHRAPELHRAEARDRLVGVVVDLRTEATADRWCDDPHLVLGEP